MGPNMPEKGQIIKNLLYLYTCWVKAKNYVMNLMKPSTDIVKIMAPGSEVQTLEWGQYRHIVKMDLVSINLFFLFPYMIV